MKVNFPNTDEKSLSQGCELVDSLAWNPHKMMGAPIQTSIFITRHGKALSEANSASASYLFQKDKFYDIGYDTGDKSIQCGRKPDAFKFWFMLKAKGEKYFESETIIHEDELSVILIKFCRGN